MLTSLERKQVMHSLHRQRRVLDKQATTTTIQNCSRYAANKVFKPPVEIVGALLKIAPARGKVS